MQVGIQSELLSIPVPNEKFPLVQRHFRHAKTKDLELNRVAEAVLGRFYISRCFRGNGYINGCSNF